MDEYLVHALWVLFLLNALLGGIVYWGWHSFPKVISNRIAQLLVLLAGIPTALQVMPIDLEWKQLVPPEALPPLMLTWGIWFLVARNIPAPEGDE